jgi:hypothetical protein
VNRAITGMNDKLFLMEGSSLRKESMFKSSYYMYHEMLAVHFDVIWELIYNVQAVRIPYEEDDFLLSLSNRGFVTTLSLARVHMRHANLFKKNHDSSSVMRQSQPSRLVACRQSNIRFAYSFACRTSRLSTHAAPNANGMM